MALAPLAVEGLRPGTLVEVTGPPEGPSEGSTVGSPVGKLGQLVSYDEETTTFQVCTVDGFQRPFKVENLKVPEGLKRPGLGGDADTFDVLVGPRLQEDILAEEVAACLFEKGFCVLKLCQEHQEVDEALAATRELSNAGKLQRLPEEVEEGYLGTGHRGKVAWLDPGNPESPQDPLLRRSDAFISALAALIQPFCADTVGKTIDERTPGLVSLTLSDEEEPEFPPAEANDAILGSFLSTWRRSLIRVVHFMGPATGAVTLEVKEEGEGKSLPFQLETTLDVNMPPNSILIFRTGIFNYSCHFEEECLSLSASLLEQTNRLILTDWEGDTGFLRFGDGPPPPVEENINVINLSSRLMAGWDEPECYRAGLYGGCDAGMQIPFMRWDVREYYNPDADALLPFQTSTKHQSVVEGIELFDNKYFEIVASEARSMDPMQRHVLEVGAHNLFKMGITKKYSNRNPHHGGCSVGLDKDDWDKVDHMYEGGQNVQAIISNRFSFIFNLKGPNFVADTACSSSLSATHLAKLALLDQTIDKIEFHVAIGIHQCLSPLPFVGCSQTHMCSPIGRCLTFNASAGGYMRGDGCSGMTLKHGYLPEERDVIWRASFCGQNGRSATLTAPNGLAQEDVIWKCFREARMTPPESCVWNCHGTGTSLGDPIEVGAIRKVQIKHERGTILMVTTNKTHTGHLEGGAAMTSLIGAVHQAKMACAIPFCHFRQLNPHLEQSSFSASFSDCFNSYMYTRGNVHISSFGFGGTNGHAIFWGEAVLATVGDIESLLKQRLQRQAPPEVRVNGSDPSLWEWDGPDKDVKMGDKYTITLRSDEPIETPVKFVKATDGAVEDDEDDDYYTITGPFCDWEGERMGEGPVTGMRTITLEVPENGLLEFRFLKNGNEHEVLYPGVDKCSKKSASILGPNKEDRGLEKNVWCAEATPGSSLRIDLFVCRGRKSLMWMPV